MAFFYPSRFKTFFVKHDVNTLYQEISAAFIGLVAGLYAYEKRDEFFSILGVEGYDKKFTFTWPESWTTSENQTAFMWFVGILIAVLIIKVLLYIGFLDLNHFFGKASKKSEGFDLNGILQELTTIILGMTVGIFSSPVTKSTWLGLSSREDYPNPVPGIIVAAVCLAIKVLLYSEALNLNAFFGRRRGRLVDPGALYTFFRTEDWNIPVKEFLSTLIGIGVGLYLYQSNLIFMPMKWANTISEKFSSLDEKVGSPIKSIGKAVGAEKVTNEIGKITGEASRISKILNKQMSLIPEIKEENKIYWQIGLAVVIGSFIIKLLMYLNMLNFNKVRDGIFGSKGPSREFSGRDYNGIADEIVMFLLTSLMGVMIDPIYNNLRGNPTDYPYGEWSLVVLIALVLAKLLLIMGVLDFNRQGGSKSPVKKLKKLVKRR